MLANFFWYAALGRCAVPPVALPQLAPRLVRRHRQALPALLRVHPPQGRDDAAHQGHRHDLRPLAHRPDHRLRHLPARVGRPGPGPRPHRVRPRRRAALPRHLHRALRRRRRRSTPTTGGTTGDDEAPTTAARTATAAVAAATAADPPVRLGRRVATARWEDPHGWRDDLGRGRARVGRATRHTQSCAGPARHRRRRTRRCTRARTWSGPHGRPTRVRSRSSARTAVAARTKGQAMSVMRTKSIEQSIPRVTSPSTSSRNASPRSTSPSSASASSSAPGSSPSPGARPNQLAGPADPHLVHHRRDLLRARGALLRRVRVVHPRVGVGVHVLLRVARRARRLDHRLGPAARALLGAAVVAQGWSAYLGVLPRPPRHHDPRVGRLRLVVRPAGVPARARAHRRSSRSGSRSRCGSTWRSSR